MKHVNLTILKVENGYVVSTRGTNNEVREYVASTERDARKLVKDNIGELVTLNELETPPQPPPPPAAPPPPPEEYDDEDL